jgi:hypothetical protein
VVASSTGLRADRFQYLIGSSFSHVIRLRDEHGRPLGECKVAEPLCFEVEMEVKTCKYSGSRYEHPFPMNVSALKQMTESWRDIQEVLSLLRTLYISHGNRQLVTLTDLWRVGKMAESLPSFLKMRAVGCDYIPVVVSALFKACIGINFAIQCAFIMAKTRGGDGYAVQPDGHSLYQFADRNGLLIGSTQVCSGSEQMITELVDVLRDGTDHVSPSAHAVLDVIVRNGSIYDYAQHLARYSVAGFLFRTLESYLVADLLQLSGCITANNRVANPFVTAVRDLRPLAPNNSPEARIGRQFVKLSPRERSQIMKELQMPLVDMANEYEGQESVRITTAMIESSGPSPAASCIRWIKTNAEGRDAFEDSLLTKVAERFASFITLERLWLELNCLTEAALGSSLGYKVERESVRQADEHFGKSLLRRCFEAWLGAGIRHDEAATVLAREGTEFVVPA